MFSFLNHPNLGLLLLRIGLGIMFILHGQPKMFGGIEAWTKLGAVVGLLGIKFYPAFWGFMAAFAEFGGGIMLILGLRTRFAAFLMLMTMLMASYMHFRKGDDFTASSHAIELAIVFGSLLFMGAGNFSLDHKFKNK